MHSSIDKVFKYILIVFLLNSTACMKRVAVPLGAEELKNQDVVVVHLKSGMEYKLKNPKFEEADLEGIYLNKRIRIPLAAIKLIEIERPDKKKFIISFAAIMGTLAIFAILFYPFGAFEGLD